MANRNEHLNDAILLLKGAPEARERAFENLRAYTHPILVAYRVSRGARATQAEDIAQEALIRIWRNLERLDFPSLAHWLAYAKRVSDRLAVDSISKLKSADLNDADGMGETDGVLEQAIAHRLDQESLFEHADNLWLGEKPTEFAARLLAATMMFVDRVPRTRVQRWLDRTPVTAKPGFQLTTWVEHPRVLRSLAFGQFYVLPRTISDLIHEQLAPLPPLESEIVTRKYLSYEATPVILNSLATAEERESISEFLGRCESHLPFVSSMVVLWGALGATEQRAETFCKPGLWKRLAFQYSFDGLPHADIAQRFGPVAAIADFKLDAMTLHAWISNRRLHKELGTYMKAQGFVLEETDA